MMFANRVISGLAASLLLGVTASAVVAGPYPSFSDTSHQVLPGQISAWATSVVDYSPTAGVDAAYADASHALAANDGGIVSLGDLDAAQIAAGDLPGTLTVKFDTLISDLAGPDLAVFENASQFYTDPVIFAELAYVEVSSNGTDFVRFPSVSLNTEDDLVANFGRAYAGADTTNIYNLAGVHPTGIGTPFDLAELSGMAEVVSGAVDLSAIQYVRLVDIPGSGDFVDSLGNPIFDAWVTTGSGGLDLDAVGAINTVPEPSTTLLALLGIALVAGGRLAKRG
ncbi:PEP-CTERM sorting domain-containing protein [Aeoliella mucimassa]|uniref:Ice-binding protein C-terminal domain-containing protein n=1 Tax=Aeoliella mucimassa TaxID=2527972 RepID=A0A518AIA8_9BACT|nr:PEP-CTERM sorting domain-containing protein [Aeoliella mucimassa]QDU54452.1 hypothetical protein Pan181_06340 [Aeoliella mucimassa]